MSNLDFDDFIKLSNSKKIVLNTQKHIISKALLDDDTSDSPIVWTFPKWVYEKYRDVTFIDPNRRTAIDLICLKGKTKNGDYCENEYYAKIHKENVNYLIDEDGENVVYTISIPGFDELLKAFFPNIEFNSPSYITLLPESDFGNIDGRFFINIPKSLAAKGIDYLRKYHDGELALGYTTVYLDFNTWVAGTMPPRRYYLIIKDDFLSVTQYESLMRLSKLYHGDEEFEANYVGMKVDLNVKNQYLEAFTKKNVLQNVNDLLERFKKE